MTEPPNKKQRLPNFKIEFRGDIDKKRKLQSKIQKVKTFLQKNSDACVTNYEAIERCLDLFLEENDCEKLYPMPQTYIQIIKESSEDEQLFVAAKCAVDKSFEIGQHHGKLCDKPLKIQKSLSIRTCCLMCSQML